MSLAERISTGQDMAGAVLPEPVKQQGLRFLGIGREAETYRQRHLQQYDNIGSIAMVGNFGRHDQEDPYRRGTIATAEYISDVLKDNGITREGGIVGIGVYVAATYEGSPTSMFDAAYALEEAIDDQNGAFAMVDPDPSRVGEKSSSRNVDGFHDALHENLRELEAKVHELGTLGLHYGSVSYIGLMGGSPADMIFGDPSPSTTQLKRDRVINLKRAGRTARQNLWTPVGRDQARLVNRAQEVRQDRTDPEPDLAESMDQTANVAS